MNVDGKAYRTIWLGQDGWSVEIIDQTRLPHEFVTARLSTLDGAGRAIESMHLFPLAASKADRMPLMPSVKTRPPASAGVDFGPLPCPAAAGFIR